MSWIDRLEKNQKKDSSRVIPLEENAEDIFPDLGENETKQENIIYILYHYDYFSDEKLSLENQGGGEILRGVYTISKVFIDSLLVDHKDFLELYEQIYAQRISLSSKKEILNEEFHKRDIKIGPFEGLMEINQYLAEIIKKFSLDAAYLISTEDYNRGLATITEKSEFISIFKSFGRRIESLGASRSKSSWFRLF